MLTEPLTILYRDDYYIAIDKPSGLLVHRSPIDKNETQFALQQVRNQIAQHIYPIHRLDKPTSGVLLFGLSSESAHKMQQQFLTNKNLTDPSTINNQPSSIVQKIYHAIVRGYTPKNLTIDRPVKAQLDKKYSTNTIPKDGQTLLTTLAQYELPFQVDKYPNSRYSLVKLIPFTGRRHQLRYHMKHISHPIIGDAKYGKSKHNQLFTTLFNNQRLCLNATQLIFQHPYSQEKITITSQNKYLTTLCKQLEQASKEIFIYT